MLNRKEIVTAALGLLTLAGAATAQLPSASASALGMGDNFTAVARGYHAIAWNPALLGIPGNPRLSFAIVPARLVAGLDPVTLGDIKKFEGIVVPARTRDQWLDAVRNEGSEEGTGGADVTYLAAQYRAFGLQISTRARTIANLSPGAVQLLLFGNADANGTPQSIDVSGAQLTTFATSTVAASYAIPLRSATGSMAFGATLKYTIGHLLLFGQEENSQISDSPITFDLRFPIVGTISELEDHGLNNGHGIGIDVGFAMQRERLTLGLTVQNIFSSFEWRTDNLVFRPGTFLFNADSSVADIDEQAYTAAPATLRELISEMKYRPNVAAGGAYQFSDKLLLSADARTRLGDVGIGEGLDDGPDFQVGVGAEYKVTSRVPLRAGVALINGGVQLATGIGVSVGAFDLSASIMKRDAELGSDIVTMFTLISTRR